MKENEVTSEQLSQRQTIVRMRDNADALDHTLPSLLALNERLHPAELAVLREVAGFLRSEASRREQKRLCAECGEPQVERDAIFENGNSGTVISCSYGHGLRPTTTLCYPREQNDSPPDDGLREAIARVKREIEEGNKIWGGVKGYTFAPRVTALRTDLRLILAVVERDLERREGKKL